MPKLDIGVGDEFPAKEVKDEPSRDDDEGPSVHHHHYYRGRYGRYGRYGDYRYYRYRGRWLWFVLWILVITAVFRSFDMAAGATGWAWSQWGGPWGAMGSWMWAPYHAIKGLLMTILIIAGLIWIAHWRNREELRDIEREQREEDRR